MPLLNQYLQGHALIIESIKGLTEDQMKTRVEEGKWTIHENVIHLADADLVYSERIKRILAEEQAVLLPFDQDLWTTRLNYHQSDLQTYLELFRLTRESIGSLLRELSEEEWSKNGFKDGQPLAISELIQALVEHVNTHVNTIKRLRQKIEANR